MTVTWKSYDNHTNTMHVQYTRMYYKFLRILSHSYVHTYIRMPNTVFVVSIRTYCTYVHTYIYVVGHMYVCMYVHTSLCVHVYDTYVRMYVCTSNLVDIRTYVYMYICYRGCNEISIVYQ